VRWVGWMRVRLATPTLNYGPLFYPAWGKSNWNHEQRKSAGMKVYCHCMRSHDVAANPLDSEVSGRSFEGTH